MAQTVKASKWGDSLAVRIPRDIAREFHITAGKHLKVTYVEVHNIHPDE